MIMLMSPMIADHLYRGYFEGIVNYIGQEVFGTMRVFMGYDANPPESISAEQSEPTAKQGKQGYGKPTAYGSVQGTTHGIFTTPGLLCTVREVLDPILI